MKNFLKNFSFMGFLMFMLCVLLGVGDVSGAICANGAALTPPGTGESVEQSAREGGLTESQMRNRQMNGKDYELIDDPVDQKLVQIRPYANPIDTLLRYANAETVENFEWGWYQLGTDPVTDKTSNVTVTTDSSLKQNVIVTVTVSSPHLYAPSDTFKIVAANGDRLQLRVKSKSSSVLTCSPVESQIIQSGGVYTVPTINNVTDVYIMGRAASQSAISTAPTLLLPEKKTGYCQRFMMEIEQNFYEKLAKKEIKFDLTEVEEAAMFKYRQRQEGTWIDGDGGKTWDGDANEYIYTSYGLSSLITNTYDLYAGELDSNAEYVELSKHVFVGNNGAKVRYAIGGSEAIANMSKMTGNIQRMQDAMKTEEVKGITWNVLKTNFGEIRFVHHELMDTYGYSDKLFIIDPQFIKMKRIHGFQRNVVNGKEHMIVNSELVIGEEACGLAVYNSAAHCKVTVHAGERPTPQS